MVQAGEVPPLAELPRACRAAALLLQEAAEHLDEIASNSLTHRQRHAVARCVDMASQRKPEVPRGPLQEGEI